MFKKNDEIDTSQLNEEEKEGNKLHYSKGLLIFCAVLLIIIIILSLVIAFI